MVPSLLKTTTAAQTRTRPPARLSACVSDDLAGASDSSAQQAKATLLQLSKDKKDKEDQGGESGSGGAPIGYVRARVHARAHTEYAWTG